MKTFWKIVSLIFAIIIIACMCISVFTDDIDYINGDYLLLFIGGVSLIGMFGSMHMADHCKE